MINPPLKVDTGAVDAAKDVMSSNSGSHSSTSKNKFHAEDDSDHRKLIYVYFTQDIESLFSTNQQCYTKAGCLILLSFNVDCGSILRSQCCTIFLTLCFQICVAFVAVKRDRCTTLVCVLAVSNTYIKNV